MKIGLPRALLFYEHFPFWIKLLETLDQQVIISDKTDKTILNNGVTFAVDDVCLPVKVYFGHLLQLHNRDIDRILIPRMVSSQNGGYYCPKLFALADIFMANLDYKQPLLLDIEWNFKRGEKFNYNQLKLLAQKLGVYSDNKLSKAYSEAQQLQSNYNKLLKAGKRPEEILTQTTRENLTTALNHNVQELSKTNFRDVSPESQLKLGIFGHSYLIHDSFITMDLLPTIHNWGIKTVTCSKYSRTELQEGLALLDKPIFWEFGEQILGAVLKEVQNNKLDGIIIPIAFGCGPGSLILEICEQICRENSIPLLVLTLDEHTGRNGMLTRLEAFIDMIKKRRYVG